MTQSKSADSNGRSCDLSSVRSYSGVLVPPLAVNLCQVEPEEEIQGEIDREGE